MQTKVFFVFFVTDHLVLSFHVLDKGLYPLTLYQRLAIISFQCQEKEMKDAPLK